MCTFYILMCTFYRNGCGKQTNEKPQCATNTIPYYITHLKNFSKRYFYRNLNTEKFTKSQFIFIYIFELIIKKTTLNIKNLLQLPTFL